METLQRSMLHAECLQSRTINLHNKYCIIFYQKMEIETKGIFFYLCSEIFQEQPCGLLPGGLLRVWRWTLWLRSTTTSPRWRRLSSRCCRELSTRLCHWRSRAPQIRCTSSRGISPGFWRPFRNIEWIGRCRCSRLRITPCAGRQRSFRRCSWRCFSLISRTKYIRIFDGWKRQWRADHRTRGYSWIVFNALHLVTLQTREYIKHNVSNSSIARSTFDNYKNNYMDN